MFAAEIKTSSSAQNQLQTKRQPFIAHEGQGSFFSKFNEAPQSFFSTTTIQPKLTFGQTGNKYEVEADAMADTVINDVSNTESSTIQTKCTECKKEEKAVQRQEEPDLSITKSSDSNPGGNSLKQPNSGSPRVNKCLTDPEFPNFLCLTSALKLDIDENLWNNAHQFYRVASLFPGDNQLMLNTFMRYGLGANLLQTSFGFIGANKKLGTILSYGTGIGMKSYEFYKNGKLQLDIPIPLGKGIKLDFNLDLNTDPNDLKNIKSINTGIGISGHFK